jgi:hypothetical protein
MLFLPREGSFFEPARRGRKSGGSSSRLLGSAPRLPVPARAQQATMPVDRKERESNGEGFAERCAKGAVAAWNFHDQQDAG